MHISKYSSQRKKQVILLMICDSQKWHHPTVKKMFPLLDEKTINVTAIQNNSESELSPFVSNE